MTDELKYENYWVDAGPPECGGKLLLDWLCVEKSTTNYPPDGNEDFGSRQEAIRAVIDKLQGMLND